MLSLYESLEKRRSVYQINKDTSLSKSEIIQTVEVALKHTPSAYNSQSQRIVLLLDHHHDELWDMVLYVLEALVPHDQFHLTKNRISQFKEGFGTVLFYEDQAIISQYQKDYAKFKSQFPIWALQSNGMLQYVIWTSLAVKGLGASLQHYNPLIDEKVQSKWNIPETWNLMAQMPFGNPIGSLKEKEFESIYKRMVIKQNEND